MRIKDAFDKEVWTQQSVTSIIPIFVIVDLY